jgi:hypothetical protein
MAKYALLVLATPKPGTEEAYNHWHMTQHAPDVMKVSGFAVGKRYRLSSFDYDPKSPKWKFCTIYELETDDPAAALTELRRRSASGEIPLSDLSDRSKTVILALDLVSIHHPPV